MEKAKLEAINLQSEIFTAPIIADELDRMWKTRRQAVVYIAQEIAMRKPRAVVFFGSGGSAAALYSGYYSMLRYSTLPVSYLLSPELVGTKPALLNQSAVAIGASYSGKTVDTMAAKKFLQRQQVPIVTVTRAADAELAKGATWSLTYDSRALFSSPAFLTMLLALELCRVLGEWSDELEAMQQALASFPALCRQIAEASRKLAEQKAAELDEEKTKIMILAGGGAYALGYMMAFDMFGEYLKQFTAFINYGEFRHGPLEIVNQDEPTLMCLLGNDGLRPFGEATVNFGRKNGARTVIFDAAELAPGAHPMVDALVLYQSQLWLLYYIACQRNIDLNHYLYMHVTPYAQDDTYY